MKPIPTETSTDVGSVGKWLGAAAAGALLMYALDPERGRARRARALSAVRVAGGRAGETVDHALHAAGDRLGGLKDSAASALSRGAGRLQAEAAPVLERAQQGARHGMQKAAQRMENEAGRAKEKIAASRKPEPAGRNSYETDRAYAKRQLAERHDADRHARGGLADTLQGLVDRLGGTHGVQPALLGSSAMGLLGLVRRSPAALLVGLAGIYLLTRGAGTQTYKVGDMGHGQAIDDVEPAPFVPARPEAGGQYLH